MKMAWKHVTILCAVITSQTRETFQGKHFVQQTGTAIGTKIAPSYENLYMGRFEDRFEKPPINLSCGSDI